MGKNSSEFSQGHQTKEIKEKFQICHLCMKNTSQSAQCSIKRCKNSFCFQCITSNFNKDFKPTQYVKQCWVCFSCGGSCRCLFCTGIDRNRKKRSTKLQSSQKTPQTSKINDEKQSQKDFSKEIDQKQSQQKVISNQIYKSRYEKRRLPAKKKIVFKYKTKRRSRNKGSNQIKSLLQKLDEKDKILKIKRQNVHQKQSEQNQNFHSSEVQSIQDSQDSQSIIQKSPIIEEQMDEENQKNSKTLPNTKRKQTNKQFLQNRPENELKSQSDFSSSLDFLQEKEVSRNLNKKIPQNKRQKENFLLQILPTIKSVGSQIQAEKPMNEVLRKMRENGQKEQELEIVKPQDKVIQTRQTRSKRIKQDPSKAVNFSEINYQNVKKRRYTRRTEKIQGNRQIKQDKKSKGQRQTQQRQIDRPRRSTRKNYVELEEGIKFTGDNLGRKKSTKNLKKQQIQLSSEMDQQQQYGQNHSENPNPNNNDDQEIEKPSSNQIQEPQQIQEAEEQQQDIIEQKQEQRKKHKNKDIRKHYQQELEKNIQFQVNDSESSENQENLQKNNLKIEDSKEVFSAMFEENLMSVAQNVEIGQNNDNGVKQQSAEQIESVNKTETITVKNIKPTDTKGQQQGAKVYRKGGANKRTHHINSHTKLNQTHRNSITSKWAAIPDKYLINIKNIQRLGYQALFARQNLSKQMGELIQRRNKILSQIAKGSIKNQVKLS